MTPTATPVDSCGSKPLTPTSLPVSPPRISKALAVGVQQTDSHSKGEKTSWMDCIKDFMMRLLQFLNLLSVPIFPYSKQKPSLLTRICAVTAAPLVLALVVYFDVGPFLPLPMALTLVLTILYHFST